MQLEVSNRQIIRIAAPICLALVMPQITHMTNTAFLGRMGEFELAANGIAGIYYLIMYMIAYGLTNGLEVLIARRAGQLNYSGIGVLFSNGILLGLLFAGCGIFITLWLAPWFFATSLHDHSIYEAAVSFIRVRIWGLPSLMLLSIANAFYVGTGNSRVLITTSICQEIVNIFFDYSLIFGHFSFPALGLNGAAYASVLAESVGMIVAFGNILVRGFHRRFYLFNYLRPDMDAMKRILTVSAPLIVQFLFSIGVWFVFFIFIEHLGKRSLAISNIMRSVMGLFGVFTWALASTCNTLVSNVIGQGKPEQVFPAIRKVVTFSLSCALTVCLLINLMPNLLLHVYTTDPVIIHDALPSLRVITINMLMLATSTILLNGVTGTGNTRMNLLIEICALIGYLTYCIIVVERWRSPLYIAWLSDCLYSGIIFIISFWYLRSGKWKGKMI